MRAMRATLSDQPRDSPASTRGSRRSTGPNALAESLTTSPIHVDVATGARSTSTRRSTPRPARSRPGSKRSSTGARTRRASSCNATSVRICDASGSGRRCSMLSAGERERLFGERVRIGRVGRVPLVATRCRSVGKDPRLSKPALVERGERCRRRAFAGRRAVARSMPTTPGRASTRIE